MKKLAGFVCIAAAMAIALGSVPRLWRHNWSVVLKFGRTRNSRRTLTVVNLTGPPGCGSLSSREKRHTRPRWSHNIWHCGRGVSV